MDTERTLASFGLTGKKAKVYLASLELGISNVQGIAAKAGIRRTTAYDILDDLVKMGLVSQIERDKKQHFRAEDPENLRRLLKEKETVLVTMLPELRSIYNASVVKPAIRFYEETEGIKTVLMDTLEAHSKQLDGILSMRDLFEAPGREYMEQYVARRVEAGVSLRVVRSREKELEDVWPTDPSELREVRYSPVGMVFVMTSFIYDSKVAFISSRKENFGMIIESQDFARTFRNLFEILWISSEKV